MNDETMTMTKPEVKTIHQYVRNEELSLHIHSHENAFSALEHEWTNLAELSNQMVCMSPGWAASWWKHFGRHQKRSLFIVTVYDHQKLVAIFPFYKGITNMAGMTIQKRLQLIGSGGNSNEQYGFSDDYGVSDFLDLIVHPEYKTQVAELFINLLDAPQFTVHQISFHQARDDSYIMQTLYPLLKKAKPTIQAEVIDTCPYIELDRGWTLQDFIKRSKSSARRRFRQTLRARGTENDFIIEEPHSPADVEKMITRLIQLHQERWNKIGFPGSFEDERFKEFFKEISFEAYRNNRLWIKQAVDESGVCAVRMLLLYNRRYYDYMSGYDDDSPSARRRPGIGLLLDLVKDALEQPVERIELLRGDEGYKYDFTQLALNNWKVTIPEQREWKTVWGMLPGIAQACSIAFKYFNREKMLLNVQYQKAGFLAMFSGYFKFRYNSFIHKINEIKGGG